MHDALPHGQSEPLFHTHLTDHEIVAVTGFTNRTVKEYRHQRIIPVGERHLVRRPTYSGKVVRITQIFTPIDDMRAWLVAHRPQSLPALDKLIADKLAATPGAGE